RADIDAVVIGTPSDTHAHLMLLAARAGKAVLCEKPVDNDLAKADAAVAELKKLGAKVMMAFNRRFDPSNIELRRAIDAGDIGEVRQVIITSRDPGLPPRDYVAHSGGIFRDMAIHDFDMARFLLGEEPVEVYAKASRVVDPALMEEFDDHDTLMVIMQTASGKQCHINCCREASYGYDQRFEILGSKGMLMNDNLRPSTVRRFTAAETEAREPLLTAAHHAVGWPSGAAPGRGRDRVGPHRPRRGGLSARTGGRRGLSLPVSSHSLHQAPGDGPGPGPARACAVLAGTFHDIWRQA
ncbi:MAG: hypothetical protein RL223_1574, partial [Pseudomonadota bacterium]